MALPSPCATVSPWQSLRTLRDDDLGVSMPVTSCGVLTAACCSEWEGSGVPLALNTEGRVPRFARMHTVCEGLRGPPPMLGAPWPCCTLSTLERTASPAGKRCDALFPFRL